MGGVSKEKDTNADKSTFRAIMDYFGGKIAPANGPKPREPISSEHKNVKVQELVAKEEKVQEPMIEEPTGMDKEKVDATAPMVGGVSKEKDTNADKSTLRDIVRYIGEKIAPANGPKPREPTSEENNNAKVREPEVKEDKVQEPTIVEETAKESKIDESANESREAEKPLAKKASTNRLWRLKR